MKRLLAVLLALIIFGISCTYADICTIKAYDEDGLVSEAEISGEVSSDEEQSVDIQSVKNNEFNAVWISYLEFDSKGYSESEFKEHIDEIFDNVASIGMNAVVVHVRPFGDAFYPSKYFPWSRYVSGEQGKNPGYDPLAYMVKAAHERGLEFHAWINPYRITSSGTDVNVLSKDNQARIWASSKSTKRLVLSYGGKLYYNPSYARVRNLIVNGVIEIVENYDVDGIHFDDYFYPAFGDNYETVFDAQEYNSYKSKQIKAGAAYMNIADYRRKQVSTLVNRVYTAIKKIDNNVVFGISPEGYLPNLLDDTRHYTEVEKWINKKGYIDYICPQIYFSFEHTKAAFDLCVNQWTDLRNNSSPVKLYIGIPVYKAGTNVESQFKTDKNVLKKMLEYSRATNEVSGFIYYRYENLFGDTAKKAVAQMLKVIE